MRRYSYAVVVAMLGAFAPGIAEAQIRALDQFQQTVNRELRRYEEMFDVSNMTHEVWMGELRAGQNRRLSVPLDANVEYLILGVCDEDCSDIDLKLYRGDAMIDEDLAADDFPIVNVTPGRSEEYSLEVLMVTCSVEPCRYGVAVYAQ